MTTATAGKVRSISIQPAPTKDDPLKLPYPYHIDSDGNVGRQEFWRGHPAKLVGFAKRPKAGEVDVEFDDFWMVPEVSVDLYPVFENADGGMFTLLSPIKNYSFNR